MYVSFEIDDGAGSSNEKELPGGDSLRKTLRCLDLP